MAASRSTQKSVSSPSISPPKTSANPTKSGPTTRTRRAPPRSSSGPLENLIENNHPALLSVKWRCEDPVVRYILRHLLAAHEKSFLNPTGCRDCNALFAYYLHGIHQGEEAP